MRDTVEIIGLQAGKDVNVAVDKLVMLGILCSAAHWLIARASITKFMWSRLRGGPIGSLLECPACSGWWLGMLAGGLLHLWPVATNNSGANVIISALLGAYLTPVFEAVLLWGLDSSRIS